MLFENHRKFLIEGTQQELEKLHKALAGVVSSTQDTQSQVVAAEKFTVVFRKRSEDMVDGSTQGALDEVDDGN